MKNTLKEGDIVSVSDDSLDDAIEDICKKIFLAKVKYGYICVSSGNEENYRKGLDYEMGLWRYVIKV